MKKRFISISIAALMGLCLTFSAWAGPVTNFQGKSLTEWQTTYFLWSWNKINASLDENGNAVINKNVVLMPIPSTGIQNATLSNGEAFVLPLWALIGQTYQDNSVDDFQYYTKFFPTLNLTVKLDGKTVIDSKNMMKFYSAYTFNPPIAYDDVNSGSKAQNWFQSIGMIVTPLSVGQHTILYDGWNTDTSGGFLFEYHNTWNINVIDKDSLLAFAQSNHSVPEPATMLLLGLGLMGLAGLRRKLNNNL